MSSEDFRPRAGRAVSAKTLAASVQVALIVGNRFYRLGFFADPAGVKTWRRLWWNLYIIKGRFDR